MRLAKAQYVIQFEVQHCGKGKLDWQLLQMSLPHE